MSAAIGNQYAANKRRWQAAIDRALEKRSKAAGIEELDRLAEKFLDEVEAQGINGFKELGDRMDGKAKQQIEASGADGGPIETVLRWASEK